MRAIISYFTSFPLDNRGAVAVMFGVSAIVLFAIAGLAIDSSRVYYVSIKMREALDAGALAAAKILDDENATDAQIQQTGESFVKSSLKELRVDHVTWKNVKLTADRTTGTVTASADVSMPALFGAISSSLSIFNFTPTSTVIYRPKKIELALVLDITGSMCDVPPGNVNNACSSGTKISGLKNAADGMLQALADTDPAKDAIRVAIAPYSASVNAGSLASAVSGGASVDDCVVERNGVGAYTDAPPSGAGSWLGTASIANTPAYSCPSASVLPLTDVSDSAGQNTVRNAINALRGFGGTAGHIGLAWGWYLVSPSWTGIFPAASQPKPYDKDKVIKVIVLMTDGMFNTSYRNGGQYYIWPDASTSDPLKPGTSGYQALKICENIRNLDGQLQIYTVGFQTPPEAEALLKECAGADNFINVDSAAQLSEAFKKIAYKLTMLRVSG